jgi:hypothetical protein
MLRAALFVVVAGLLVLPACGKREPDSKAAREAEEKRREEKAMSNPERTFDRAMKTQENSAKRAAEYRKKVDDEAQKKYESGEAAKK